MNCTSFPFLPFLTLKSSLHDQVTRLLLFDAKKDISLTPSNFTLITHVIGMRIRASRMSWSKLEFFRCCVSQVLYHKWSASTSLNEQCELLCRLLQEHLSPQWFPLAAICGQFPPSNQQCYICNVVNNKWEKNLSRNSINSSRSVKSQVLIQ